MELKSHGTVSFYLINNENFMYADFYHGAHVTDIIFTCGSDRHGIKKIVYKNLCYKYAVLWIL